MRKYLFIQANVEKTVDNQNYYLDFGMQHQDSLKWINPNNFLTIKMYR